MNVNIDHNTGGGVIIGIDPDAVKSGMAAINSQGRILSVITQPFTTLVDTLLYWHEKSERGAFFKVFVEAGWLNKSNWHLGYKDTKQIAAAKGVAVGRNQQVGHLIIEMCEHYGINVAAVRPLRKCWQGKDGKITQSEMQQITQQQVPRTNQEGRDALLLAWVHANLPIREAKYTK